MRQKDEHFIKALKKTPCNKSGKFARNPNKAIMEKMILQSKTLDWKSFDSKIV